MARRKKTKGFLELLIGVHWLVSVILALSAFIALRWGMPALMMRNPYTAGLATTSSEFASLAGLVLLTPAPFAWWRGRKETLLLEKLQDIEGLRAMSWHKLEILVKAMYERMGYSAERLGGEGPDGGIDVVIRRGREKVLVQCKQWRTRQVPVNVVRELLGVVTAERATRGIVITCGTFTGDAWDFASDNDIELVDGMRLLEMVKGVQQNSGDMEIPAVSPSPVAIPSNDVPMQTCPSCNGQMVIRKAGRGANAGRQFLGCTRYPACRGTRPL